MRYCDFVNLYKKDEDFFPMNYVELMFFMYYDITSCLRTLFCWTTLALTY